MGAELGRISGPLLSANLLRDGVDLAFETDLLYLNVNNKRIGIKTDTPTRGLQVLGDSQTANLLVDTLITTPVFEINSAETITWYSGNINITASNYVFADNIRTDSLNIQNNIISTVVENDSIEIRPNGTGTVEFFSNVNITGNLYTPYDITLDGNLTFGSDNSDNVAFLADIDSDVIPNLDNTYSLGSNSKRWSLVNSYLINGLDVDTGSINIPGITNIALRQGNIWYVAANGADTNEGDHQNGPFASIAKALSVAQPGDTVNIFPGTYTEVFPLTVPSGVTVKGQNLRAVTVKPTLATNTNNSFLLNGETTISDITVADFYSPGYAFSFAPNTLSNTRSPYVQNVSVITRGTAITEDDPLGFASSDAGRGALVDGAVLSATSTNRAMLFHSVTFITPGVDALTMTNGVRVEWLNSFTYYANRGLYATAGSLGFASAGVEFGAELRSIGSANVYGNYGAEANGTDTLMYLIQHNFGYIGSGKDSSNDISLVIQANETVELDTGKIYYQSMDQTGDFRVGDTFHADFQTGLITLNGVATTASGISSINFGDENSETNIDATQVNTSNITFSGNTLSSLAGPVNLTSATGTLNLTQNVLIAKNMSVIGFLHLDGELVLGNQPTDVVELDAPVENDILPKQHNFFGLGTDLKRWLKTYTTESRVDDITVINNNTITTIASNADLRFESLGGKISVPDVGVEFNQALRVEAASNFKNTIITGLLTQLGPLLRTGTTNQTGAFNQTGNLIVTSTAQFDDVKVDSNSVTSVATSPATDLNLVLKAAGTGKIYIPSDLAEFGVNATVATLTSANAVQVTNTITAGSFSTGDILVEDNLITTTVSYNDLRLEVAGTGKLSVPLDNVEFDQTLTVNGITTLQAVNIGANGVGNARTLTHVGGYLLTGAIDQTGDRQVSGTLGVTSSAFLKNVDIINNTISTKGLAPLDLVLGAVGTGIVKSLKSVLIGQTLEVTGTAYTSDITNSTTITSDIFTTGDISIDNNTVTTTLSNSNLSLRATDLTKNVYVPDHNVTLSQALTVIGTSNLTNSAITGTVTHYGLLVRNGNTVQTGAYQLDNITTNNDVLFPNMSFIDKRISTRTLGSDLELRAAGPGKINIESDNVQIDQTLQIDGIWTTSTINNTTSTTTSDIFKTSGIEIDNNIIKSIVTDSNLILAGNGTGGPRLEKVKFNNNVISTESNNDNIVFTPGTDKILNINAVNALKLPAGTTANRPVGILGELRFNTTDNLFGGWSTSRRTFAGVYSADRLTYARAHPTDNTVSFVANLVPTMDVLTDRLRLNGLTIDNIQVNNNTFTAIPANTDLNITPNGSGNVIANKIQFESNLWTNLESSLPLVIRHTADGHLTFGGTYGIVIPVGDTASQPAVPEVGDLRYNTELLAAEIWEGTRYIPITGTGDIATGAIVNELGDIWSLILG